MFLCDNCRDSSVSADTMVVSGYCDGCGMVRECIEVEPDVVEQTPSKDPILERLTKRRKNRPARAIGPAEFVSAQFGQHTYKAWLKRDSYGRGYCRLEETDVEGETGRVVDFYGEVFIRVLLGAAIIMKEEGF